MKKASLSLASSNSMQHANVLESHLETELSKLESRRDSILHIARQTATACSQDIGDEGNQVDVADGKEKYDEGPVMDLVSSDEESNAETSAGEFEGPIFDDLLEMYISDQDSGLQPLTDAQQSVYSIAMEGDETEAVAIHPYSNVTLLRKDMRRILPGEWLSDEVFLAVLDLHVALWLLRAGDVFAVRPHVNIRFLRR